MCGIELGGKGAGRLPAGRSITNSPQGVAPPKRCGMKLRLAQEFPSGVRWLMRQTKDGRTKSNGKIAGNSGSGR